MMRTTMVAKIPKLAKTTTLTRTRATSRRSSPAVLLPDLEVHRDVVALRGDALQEGDGVVQSALRVRTLGVRLGDRLLRPGLLRLEVRNLALQKRDRGGGLVGEGLELLDRVVLLLVGHLDVLLHVLLDKAQDPLDPVALALGPAVGLGPGLRGRGRGLAGSLDESQAVVLVELVQHRHGLLDEADSGLVRGLVPFVGRLLQR